MMKPLRLIGRSSGRAVVNACFAIALCAVTISHVEAVPLSFGSNYYEFVNVVDPFTGNNNSWDTAKAAAEQSTFQGIAGHLATVTSQQENDFLFNLVSGTFSGFAGAWIGGKEPEGWLVGPEAGSSFAYVNWGGIEPNNQGYAYLSIGTVNAPGKWFDDSTVQGGVFTPGGQGVPDATSDPVVGYFVEYEGVPIPEPPVTMLLGVGILVGVAACRKRR